MVNEGVFLDRGKETDNNTLYRLRPGCILFRGYCGEGRCALSFFFFSLYYHRTYRQQPDRQ